MKNFVHFTFIISLLLVFSGCSKDDDDENKPMSSIRVKIHYDSEGESPEGQFMIFDLENNNIQNFEPHYRHPADDPGVRHSGRGPGLSGV